MIPESTRRLLIMSILGTLAFALVALALTAVVIGMLNNPGPGWMLAGWGVVVGAGVKKGAKR